MFFAFVFYGILLLMLVFIPTRVCVFFFCFFLFFFWNLDLAQYSGRCL